MIKEKNILNISALGIFLLLWATQAFLIAGDNGKYLALFVGLFLLASVFFRRKFLKQEVRFYIVSLFFYIGYLGIAFIQDQKTLNLLSLSFGLINLILLCVGYSLGLKGHLEVKISNKIITIITILSFIGALKFLQLQITTFTQGLVGRGVGDDLLNPVGVAYTNSLLFLFLFWLFKNTEKRILKFAIVVCMLLTFFVLISTMSRGAMLYLFIIFLLFYFRGIKLNKLALINSVKLITFIIFFSLIIVLVAQKIPALQIKIDGIIKRFSTLLTFVESSNGDASAEIRKNVYRYFFNNISNFILLGQYRYIPYPHNQFLEIIMRWGVFGFPLLLFSLRNLWISLKLFKKNFLLENKMLFLIILLFLFSYFQSMSSTSLEMNRTLWLGFGFLSSYKNKQK